MAILIILGKGTDEQLQWCKSEQNGVEIVPMLSLSNSMSTGVSYFEQMKSDLEYRGESDIDIPMLVLGIDI